jgi:hypothetical protein
MVISNDYRVSHFESAPTYSGLTVLPRGKPGSGSRNVSGLYTRFSTKRIGPPILPGRDSLYCRPVGLLAHKKNLQVVLTGLLMPDCYSGIHVAGFNPLDKTSMANSPSLW